MIPPFLPAPVPAVLPQALPGSTPTPHDPAAADPFLALLTQLVGPQAPAAAGVPEPPEEPETSEEPADGATPESTDADPGTVAAPVPAVPLPTTPHPILTVPPRVAADAARAPEPTAEQAAEPAGAVATAPAVPAVPAGLVVAERPTPLPTAEVAATPQGPAPVGATAATTAAPLNHRAGGAPETPPVTRQVFPEVVRAAVTGATPNRVVVRLDPEHLGEVRVVLRTDRSGSLEVSLAGGPDARAALREGAPELRRLLEAAGSHDARVVVRHLAETAPAGTAGPAAAPTSARPDVPTTAGGLPVDVGAGTAGGTAHDSSSGTGGEGRGRIMQDARPGATDGIPDRPVETALTAREPARAGGLDVMM